MSWYGYEVSPDPIVRTRSWRNRRTDRTVELSEGVDPGFDHNPGRLPAVENSSRIYRAKRAAAPGDLARAAEATARRLADAVEEIDGLGPVAARRRVRELRDDGDAFAAHVAALSNEDWPVAVAPNAVSDALGTSTGVVRFSGWQAAKQLFRHPDLRPASYALVQRVLDDGEIFRQYTSIAVGFVEDQGAWWRAVFKAVPASDELYLLSLHRVEPRHYRRAARDLPALG